jgi:hypothetical protein
MGPTVITPNIRYLTLDLHDSFFEPGQRSSASVSTIRLSYCCPTTIFLDPATDTDIISAQHPWLFRSPVFGSGIRRTDSEAVGGCRLTRTPPRRVTRWLATSKTAAIRRLGQLFCTAQ